MDPADLDARLTTWLHTRTGTINGRRVIAVDGKTMRGARAPTGARRRTFWRRWTMPRALCWPRSGWRVPGKSDEIPALRDLLDPLDLNGAVVTADAMHTQVDTAQWIRGRGGHYLLTVKNNQKTLHRTLKALPWKDVPSTSSVERSHGRRVRRTVKALEAPKWVDFPAAAQVLQVRRTRTHQQPQGQDR
ncbi:ISAs1 family transposase [Actinomyces naeslundii]